MAEKLYSAIGLMSGTSMDGIDLAMIETDGEGEVRFGPFATRSYDAATRHLLREAVAIARALQHRDERPAKLTEAEHVVTKAHADVVNDFLRAGDFDPGSIDVVGFHGQTVLHRPAAGLTVQLGDGEALAALVGIPVVYDFRAADMAAGGQGAPFVPAYHHALFEAEGLEGPVAIVNLGGVGNVSWCAKGRNPIAFDTGPGNALLDDWMLERTGSPMDEDGRTALAGTCHEGIVAELMAHPFFAVPPPKSLDRNAFSKDAVASLSIEDAAATLAGFTAASVATASRFFPTPPRSWIVCGGGARNPALLRELARRCEAPVVVADDLGWSSTLMEAQAFAYLAVRSLRGLPLSFPSTTGAREAVTGGVYVSPKGKAA